MNKPVRSPRKWRRLMILRSAPTRMMMLAITCSLALLSSPGLAEEPVAGPFSDAVEYAQLRTVKIYGASIGTVSGYASGVIISDDGKIVTSQGIHLSANRIRVTLHDGATYEATVLDRNERLQLALLQIDAETPHFYTLSETPVYQLGDWVIAVSNAFKVADGSEPLSVNLGIISLRTQLDVRRGVQDFDYDGDILLIDAITSNPGAAGGAVVTAEQQLAGMIGKVLESTSTNTRLNYAVPSDLIAKFVAGKVKSDVPSVAPAAKATIGIRMFRLGGRNAPAYIDRVLRGSPAHKAKLRSDDLVVSINGTSVKNVGEYNEMVKQLRPGEEVTIVVKRGARLVVVQLIPEAEEQ